MPFKTILVVREPKGLDDGEWILTKPLVVETSLGEFTVPAGFTTDFVSVPKHLRSVVGQVGRAVKPAVFHDYCYVYAPTLPGTNERMSKLQAEDLFKELMTETGVSPWKRWLIHRAVLWFGHSAWNANRERESRQ